MIYRNNMRRLLAPALLLALVLFGISPFTSASAPPVAPPPPKPVAGWGGDAFGGGVLNIPAGLNANCRGHHHLYRDGATLTARHDLSLAHDMAVLGMTWIPERLDSLVIQDDEVRHAAGSARASAHNSTSSGLASGWFVAISIAAWRNRPG